MSLGTTLSKTIWPFSPQCVPNLLLWIDAADTSSYTPSAAITTCRNKGYSSGNTSVTGTVNATSTTINSLPAFAFAINTVMLCPSMTFTQTTRTVFVVVNIGASGSTRTFMTGGANTTDVQLSSVSTDLRLSQNNTVVYAVTSPSPFFSTTSIVCATTLSGSSGLFINGTSQTLATNNTLAYAAATTTQQQLGLNSTATFTLGEAMIFDGAITDIDRRNVEGYLSKKWGLQSLLPATHPYYNNATWGVSQPFNRFFSPVDITGCQLWIDASDAATVTGTTSVTNVVDKSGNNVVLSSATGFSYPNNTFNNSVGRYPSFYNPISAYTGTGSNYTLGINNSFAQTTPFTVFFVAHYTAASNFSGYIMDSGSTSTGRPYTYTQTIQTPFGTASTGVLTSPCVVSMNWITGTTTSQVFVNGALNYSGTLGALTTTGITVGNRFSLNESWPGHICELIWYSGTLNSSQRRQVESYLAFKWGLTTSLVAGHPGKTLPAFQTMFSPKSVSGLQLWLDAADYNSIVLSGANVTTWRDKSGNGYNGTATGTITVNPNGMGTNLPAMTFTNTQWFLGSMSISTSTLSIFAVYNMSSSSEASARIIGLGAPNTNDYNSTTYMGLLRQTNNIGPYRNSGFPVSVPIAYSTPSLISSWYDATTVNVTANGTLAPTSSGFAAVTFGITSYAVGNNTNTTDVNGPFYGFIGEILVYNTSLTTAQRQQVEGYLGDKWNLQPLFPAAHAYKKSLS